MTFDIRETTGFEQLVQEQLNTRHIEESTRPWNLLYMLFERNLEALTDLRAINKAIQPMVSLQPVMPLPSLLPKEYPLIDLKECFFTIPLQNKDRENFALMVPTYNNSQQVKKYQWKVLPQEKLNNSTLCQYFVQNPLEITCVQFP